MSRKNRTQDNGFNKVIRATLVGMAVGCAVCALLLWIVSFIFVKSKTLPIGIIGVAVVVIAGISSFVGAYFAIKISKSNGLIVGAMTGILIFLVTVLAGIISTGQTDVTQTLSRAAVMVTSGCIGGVIAVNTSGKHR